MLKTLGAQIKEYKWASIATPVFMLLEVAVDTIIPLLMASIIDNGVNMGDTRHIYIMGVWMIGYIMDNQDQNIFQKDIEAKFHLSGATVTNMLKSLEKNGYIVRTPMENDARLKRIELTQKALDHENRVRENIMVIEEAMHEGFSKEEFNMMLGFLDRVIDNMEKLNK